jgi:hypothetical protein
MQQISKTQTSKQQQSTVDDDNKKYITLPEKMDFRKIGKIMTKAGYDMNHATARNQVVAAMKEVLNTLVKDMRSEISLEQINDLVNNQEIHQALQEVLYIAYKELKQEETISAI